MGFSENPGIFLEFYKSRKSLGNFESFFFAELPWKLLEIRKFPRDFCRITTNISGDPEISSGFSKNYHEHFWEFGNFLGIFEELP